MQEVKVPRHIAIVMDGNGRWAKSHDLKRLEGHRQGAKNALDIMKYCKELGVSYLTLYAFSSENWHRPTDEVEGLMGILYRYLTEESQSFIEHEVKLQTIGDVDKLPFLVRRAVNDLKTKTAHFTKANLILALSYGGRAEFVRATQKIARRVKSGELTLHEINEQTIAQSLDTAGIPDPDLFIRTSGEWRLSNFLPFQLSYTELYFTPVAWPDFSREHLQKALQEYAARERRYGMTSEQLLEQSEPK